MAEAFTQTPSVLYQNYLMEFWCTALVVDLNPPTNDSEARPLKELSIKFTMKNVDGVDGGLKGCLDPWWDLQEVISTLAQARLTVNPTWSMKISLIVPMYSSTRTNLKLVVKKGCSQETIVKVDSQMMIQKNDVCSQQFRPQTSMSNDVCSQQSYALSWKPCQGDSLNLPDHRTLLKDIDDIFGRNLQILEDLEVVGCLKTQGAVQHTILLKTPYWPESTEQISGKFLIS
ncbi:hypothetical protein Tco_1184478 [Tanacetum coccineum]